MELLLVTALALLGVFLYIQNFRLKRRYPPGPRAWPIVGNLRDLARGQHRVFAEWRVKYGDIFTVWLGPRPAVVLNGQDAVKEALQKHGDIFSSRPDLFLWRQTIRTRGKGVATAPYGPEWKETRKVALTWLNAFGAGKQSLEPTIVQEAQDLVQVFKDKQGQPFDPTVPLSLAASNVICSLVFGRRFNHDDELFCRLMELQNRYFRSNTSAQALNVYPILRHVPSIRRKMEEVVTCSEEIRSFVIEGIQEHRETFDPNNIRDVIDGFLLEEHHGNRILTELPEDNIINVIKNLFLAGSDTTATTLRWALLYLVMNQDVQRKVQDEIDVALGKQTPSMLLRDHLPYTEATIREAQRIRSIAPSSVPHETTAPATILGHQIPAGTFILPNLWSLHMDPKYWPDPERFDPTRFLDADGQLAPGTESFLPFSIGEACPRRCLGEQLAKFELFLFFTSLLQRFTFKLPEGAPTPDTEGIFGLVFSPKPFEICAIPRN
ncbi:PREDICTED: cytochrome P450 2D6-like [Branchiostoma belcheri]|uniref:Cytochrome P450 2D6-like n=1 Tax=Branchiostoma belcheri TaxID=7741 RepID=A0A6P4ZSW0_BRABE|nr:PREDICTED: cytochrome P450 2D6-like [Branchiostoma belcheri]